MKSITVLWILIFFTSGVFSLFGASILFESTAHAQTNAEPEKFLVLPQVGYTYEQGIGIGINATWLNIASSPWTANTSLYLSSLYNQTFVTLDVANRHFYDIFVIQAGGFFNNSARSLFYGFGNGSDVANEVQYAINDNFVYARAGVRVYDEIVFGIGYDHRSTGIDRGADPTLPQFLDVYFAQPLASGTTTTSTNVFLEYDTRTPTFAPQQGNFGWISLSQAQPRSGEVIAQQRLVIEGENYYDIFGDKDLILVSRGKYDREWGENIPFFLQSPIGGQDTLRGFYLNRFTDAGSMVFNEEFRYDFLDTSGIFQRFEASTAFELGQVFDGSTFPQIGGYHTDWDIGLTALLEGGVPVRLDYAWSPEANLIYLHLFYPF